jgi:hypothetical protein
MRLRSIRQTKPRRNARLVQPRLQLMKTTKRTPRRSTLLLQIASRRIKLMEAKREKAKVKK